MDMFEKATKTVKEVGGNVIESAKNIGTSIYTTSREQSEIAGIKVQKSVIEKKLNDYYAIIGKRYLDYMKNATGEELFDVSDIITEMQPDLDKMNEIMSLLEEKEIEAKKVEEDRRKKTAQNGFDSEKAKLDKALEMNIISSEEYDEKMVLVQKKLDNYEQLRKIDLQFEMGIIDQDEYTEKVNKVLA